MRFMTKDFMLRSETARRLYHDYASEMPIFDYHSHLPPGEIADDINFDNLGQVWLKGDHYKWRAMRSNGVSERYCTGDATDWEKFQKWAATMPYCVRNPLYHWTHLELQRYFGVNKLLNPDTAKEIYEECSAKLKTPEFSVRGIISKMNVRVICTTDDPCDRLEHHKKIAADKFSTLVLPTFRPDNAMKAEDPAAYGQYLDKLGKAAGMEITSYSLLLDALKKRHDYFHACGCRISDHGIDAAYAEQFTEAEINQIFLKARGGKMLTLDELLKLKSALMLEFGRMDYVLGWTQQIHMGAMRNNNTRMLKKLGPDTGFDSIGDLPTAAALSGFLDKLDQEEKLPKTILYNLNPSDNELLATMLGNFQDGSVPGKMQFGSGWWFLDQKCGMINQINALSMLGLLSRFVGMLTDSRSFLSFPRHEYFRRILCNLIGDDVENGEIPYDMDLLGGMVRDICFNNAVRYFGIGDVVE